MKEGQEAREGCAVDTLETEVQCGGECQFGIQGWEEMWLVDK